MATFTWIPDQPLSGSQKFKVLEAKFGDGYGQRTPDGITPALRSYDARFSQLNATTYADILAFLRARKGVEAFDWTPFGEAAGKFIAKELKYEFTHIGSISATFEEVVA